MQTDFLAIRGASIAIAKKNGFKLDKNSYSKDKKWVNYVKKL